MVVCIATRQCRTAEVTAAATVDSSRIRTVERGAHSNHCHWFTRAWLQCRGAAVRAFTDEVVLDMPLLLAWAVAVGIAVIVGVVIVGDGGVRVGRGIYFCYPCCRPLFVVSPLSSTPLTQGVQPKHCGLNS